jgi:hypothetical protein
LRHTEKESVSVHEPTQEHMMRLIEEIVRFGVRRPGYDADLAVESYLADQFVDVGLTRVDREPVPVHRWAPSTTWFQLAGSDATIDCAAVPYTAWTCGDGVEAPCVYVGDGQPESFAGKNLAGKIAVLDLHFADFATGPLKENALAIYDPDGTIPDGVLHVANWLITNFTVYYEALQRGAVGLVGLLVDAPIDGCSYYVPYDGILKDLPAVWIGREHAETMRRAAQRGAVARLTSVGQTQTVDSHNVVGWVEGRGDETILLTCHHDAPFASAVEDASGLSVLLAMARMFGASPGTLERHLLFVASSGHFHGGIGNRAFITAHQDDWVPKIAAAFGTEHIAREAEPDGRGGYRLTGRPEVRAIFAVKNPTLTGLIEAGLRRHNLPRTLVVPPYLFGPEPPCDSAPFFTAGIPSACLISGPLYLFDEFDTIDKVAEVDLAPTASMFADLVRAVDPIAMAELEVGLTRRRDDPPAPPPSWFAPPDGLRQDP